MGKNQQASGLTNIIHYDNNGNITFVSGSTTLMSISSSGAITTTGVISGSNVLTASYANNAELLDGLDSTAFATTGAYSATSGSLYTVSSSAYATSGSLSTASGSFNTRVSALEATGSALSSSILSVSSSAYATSGSLSDASGSFNSRVASLETYSTNLTAKTASFATTGSNTFIGSQVVSGSLTASGSITATGTITAQTLVVQTITSSVVYSSGSNVFGNDIGNSQRFTGSVLITGSLTIAGASSATSYSGTTIYGSTVVCSPVGKFTSCIDACSGNFSSNVCVGGGLVAQQASTFGNTVALFGSTAQLYIGATAAASDYTILKWCTTDKSLNIHNQSTGGSPQLVIACNGNVGVKTIAVPSYDLEVRGNIGILSSTSAGLITTSTLCAAGTITGLVRFDGLHAPSLTSYTGPSINACKDDANYATSLVFKTTDGSGGNNVNLRITGAGVACFSGNICAPAFIGGTMSGTTIYGSTAVCSAVGKFTTCIDAGTGYFSSNVTAVRGFFNSGGNATDPIISVTGDTNTGFFFPSADTIATTTGGTERMRITSAGIACFASTVCAPAAIFTGCVGIGITSPTTKLDVYAGVCTSAILWGQTIRNEGNAATTEYGIGLKLKISGDGVPNEVYKWAGIAAVAGSNYSNRTDLALYTNTASTADATEKVRITGDGYVGIGTCTPVTQLEIKGTNAYHKVATCFFSTYNAGFAFSDYNAGITYDAGGNTMCLYSNYTGYGGIVLSTCGSPRLVIGVGACVGINNTVPRAALEINQVCSDQNNGGFMFKTMDLPDNTWTTFFTPPANWAGFTFFNWVGTNDFNRSGAAQIRWSYQSCAAQLGPTTTIFNDSQNAAGYFRNSGGNMQICVDGAGAGKRLQVMIMGSRGA